MEEQIHTLTELLVHGPNQNRLETLRVCLQATADSQTLKCMAKQKSLIAELVRIALTSSTVESGEGTVAMQALVNLTAQEIVVAMIIKQEAVSGLAKFACTSKNSAHRHAAILVMINVTRSQMGSKHTIGLARNSSDEQGLENLVCALEKGALELREVFEEAESIGEDPVFVERSDDGLAQILWNISGCKEARIALCGNGASLLRRACKGVWMGSPRRVNSLLQCARNCAIQHDLHESILQTFELVNEVACVFAPGCELREGDEDDMESEVLLRAATSSHLRASLEGGLRAAIQVITALCATAIGRSAVKECKLYPLLRDVHSSINDEEIKDDIHSVVSVTVLAEPAQDQPGEGNIGPEESSNK